MTKSGMGICLLLVLVWSLPALAGPCLDCHQGKTPAAVTQWRQSAHAAAGVGCADCHGDDHAKLDSGEMRVEAKVCGRCHQAAYAQHTASRHGMGLHSGWGCTRSQEVRNRAECRFCHEEGSTKPLSTVQCARFLQQTEEMRELGCNRCHQVEKNCAACHSNHLTARAIVQDPAVCAKCHMGPDHPQWEMWQTSQHGTLYGAAGGEVAPTCQRCHMPQGSHDVSGGITATPGGVPFAEPEFGRKRAAMLALCGDCHAAGFASRELQQGDAVRRQSTALVQTAEGVVWDLADRGLLDPMPKDRPPHPFAGQALVTDSQMLYEDTSHIERLLFKMKKYDWAKAVKGAFHQNPAYTHWYGNAELKMDLVDIRAEASRLQRPQPQSPAATAATPAQELERQLLVLKNQFERGALSAADYAAAKTRLLQGESQ